VSAPRLERLRLGDEHVLRVAGRDEDEPTHRSVAGVPDGVGHAPWHEDESTCGDRDLAASELEDGIAVRDVERLVGVRVGVQRWRRRPGGNVPTMISYAPSVSAGPKCTGSGPSEGGTTVHPLIASMAGEPR
jgi:hypothetical protein